MLQGEGTIDAPIRLKKAILFSEKLPGRSACGYSLESGRRTNHHTLLQIRLETGRTHQIRVHFSHIGHPLAGDDMYGGHLNCIGRQALCCSKVLFVHPVTGHRIELTCPPQDDMMALIQ